MYGGNGSASMVCRSIVGKIDSQYCTRAQIYVRIVLGRYPCMLIGVMRADGVMGGTRDGMLVCKVVHDGLI